MTFYTKIPSAQRCILDKPTRIWLMFYKNFFISFQLIGSMIIGYMAWILATSVTVSRFLEGSLVSYVIVFIFFAQVIL